MTSTASPTGGAPATRYLQQAGLHLQQIRTDLPRLSELGDHMAEPLLAGGEIIVPPVARYWPSELVHRAGGLMGVRAWGRGREPREQDVVFFALPDRTRWNPREDETLSVVLAGPGHLFVNGRAEDLADVAGIERIAGYTGGADPTTGDYRFDSLSPLVGFRELDQLVRGWSVIGELTASCIRHGRMPAVYMSVWFEGAMVRNASFVRHDNLHEPWSGPMFHDRLYIPPPRPGAIAAAFLDEIETIRQTLLHQQDRLAEAGRWLADARRSNRRTWVVAVGHSYPEILDWPDDHATERPLEWGRSFSSLMRALPADLGAGDTVLHLGYAPVDADHVRHWLDRGVRLIHTSPYGPGPESIEHENFLWFDLPWRPGDGTVDISGYSVRLLPASSTAHTLAHGAILSEVAERMEWR